MNPAPLRFFLENIGAGVLAPALAAAALLWAATRVPDRLGAIAAAALPLGFLAGYVLLPWAPIRPDQPWHWLPVAALAAGVAGGVGSQAGSRWVVRLVALGLAAGVSAWCLVPEWSDWEDDRIAAIAALAVGLVALAEAMRPLAAQSTGVLMPVLLGVATVVGAVVLGLSQNLKFAQLAGVVAAGLGGMALVAWRRGPISLASTIPSWVVLVGGLMFLGRAYSFSTVPLASYVLVPCAPLGLWAVEIGRLRSLRGARRIALQVMSVALPLLIALGMAVAADLAMDA